MKDASQAVLLLGHCGVEEKAAPGTARRAFEEGVAGGWG